MIVDDLQKNPNTHLLSLMPRTRCDLKIKYSSFE